MTTLVSVRTIPQPWMRPNNRLLLTWLTTLYLFISDQGLSIRSARFGSSNDNDLWSTVCLRNFEWKFSSKWPETRRALEDAQRGDGFTRYSESPMQHSVNSVFHSMLTLLGCKLLRTLIGVFSRQSLLITDHYQIRGDHNCRVAMVACKIYYRLDMLKQLAITNECRIF